MPPIKDLLDNWKSTVVALAALLVVIPSVINGINDIWVAWNGLPIGDKEKINNQLFIKHWKENPIHTKQIIIEGKSGKIPITVDVYENGDIFVDYVRLTQWFPYSDLVVKSDFHFSNTAYAGFFDKITKSIKGTTREISNVRKTAKTVERTRLLEDGSKEVQTIDINTGAIKSVKRIETDNSSNNDKPLNNKSNSTIEVIQLPKLPNDKVQIYEIDKDENEVNLQDSNKKLSDTNDSGAMQNENTDEASGAFDKNEQGTIITEEKVFEPNAIEMEKSNKANAADAKSRAAD